MVEGRTNRLLIKTPEGVLFSLTLAGPVVRFLAWVVDLATIAVLARLVGYLTAVLGLISRDLGSAVSIASYFIISVGYGIALEWVWRGQTLGKRLLGLRVMDEQGLRLTFSQVVLRNLLRVVDSLPAVYLVGGLACLISRRSQRLGDLAGGTIVVRRRLPAEPDLDRLLADKYNSFREFPHLEARLRQKTAPIEAGVALEALLRRDSLDPEARVELFREIADHFRGLAGFPAEALEGVSDEQYVRNVVDSLFRKRGE